MARNKIIYFYIEYGYLDYNGKVFGEVSTALRIGKFQDAKRINRLEAFPFEFYRRYREMRAYLLKYDQKFIFFIGVYHVQYCGNAVYIDKGDYIEVPVDSRIIVDVAYFRKVNPSYVRPRINKLARLSLLDNGIFFFTDFSDINTDEIKSNGFNPKIISENTLIICSQTVYGWSFGNK
jgi:hypothetical protein